MKIDLHHHLLQNRRNASAAKPAFFEKLAYQIFGIVANEPKLWSLAKKIGWLTQPLQNAVKGTALDPAKAWTKTRDLPPQPHGIFQRLVEETGNERTRKHSWPHPRGVESAGSPARLAWRHVGSCVRRTARQPRARMAAVRRRELRRNNLHLFAKNAADLKADFQLLASRDELKTALAKLRDAEKWQRVASHGGELTDFACQSLGLPVLLTDQGYDVQEMEKCDAGITECDALIAQTGGVVVTSRSAGGRALSVLPPHHVVIARREQLVADLPAAFELLQQKYAPNFPSMISFITGPSRTGDIERILVLGAHGPKKLTIFCV